jgi:hypothetical protein
LNIRVTDVNSSRRSGMLFGERPPRGYCFVSVEDGDKQLLASIGALYLLNVGKSYEICIDDEDRDHPLITSVVKQVFVATH